MIISEQRFWTKVNKSGSKPDPEKYLSLKERCWEWSAGKISNGYGAFYVSVKGKKVQILSHRMSWIIRNGDISDGMCVLHKCDNPSCVNPDHLFLGTNKENMKDMRDKGRGKNPPKKVGSGVGTSKLNEIQIRVIRRMHELGLPVGYSAKIFRVTRRNVSQVVARKTWRHVL